MRQSDATTHHGETTTGKRQSLAKGQGLAHDGHKQQTREQHVVHQALYTLPNGPIQRGVAAQPITQHDEQKIRKE
jgi:redox-sensitive bicupin YhaK (pirin superfamily)